METLSLQFVISYLAVQLQEGLKKFAWMPWLREGTVTANRICAAILAALSAIGIHFQYDADAGTLLVTGLTLASIAHFLVEVLRSWVAQRVLYVVTVKNGGVK